MKRKSSCESSNSVSLIKAIRFNSQKIYSSEQEILIKIKASPFALILFFLKKNETSKVFCSILRLFFVFKITFKPSSSHDVNC